MKILLVIFTFSLSLNSFSQWQSVFNIDLTGYYYYTIKKICVPDENKVFVSGLKQQNWTDPLISILYYSLDGGLIWDSLEYSDRRIDALVSPSPSTIYFITTSEIYPPVGSPYQKKYLHSSFDGGNSWNENLFDSSSFVLMTNPLACLDDSVGLLRYGAMNYNITRDYGVTWTPIVLPDHKFSAIIGSDTSLLFNEDITIIDLNTLSIQTTSYPHYGQGGLSSISVYGDTVLRYNLGQNGALLGYSNNYTILSIVEHPTTNHRVIHFPNLNGLYSVHLTENNIFLLSSMPIRSDDGGYNFYIQESMELDAADLFFSYMDMANDTIGYAVSHNFVNGKFKVQKTINAGGVTSNFIAAPLQFVANIDETDLNTSINIYPNPANGFLTISSESQIENIEIYDLQGRTVLVNQIYSNQSEIQIGNLKSGSYFIKIHSGNNIEYRTFIKD